MKNKMTIVSILSTTTILSMCVSPLGTLAKSKDSSKGVIDGAVNWVKTHVWQSAAATAGVVLIAMAKHNYDAKYIENTRTEVARLADKADGYYRKFDQATNSAEKNLQKTP